MQYTELTRKELQREYTRMTQRYSSYMREPMELDMRAEDPLLGRCENRRAAKHFGTVLGKELSDTGAARGCRGRIMHDAGLRQPHSRALPQGGRPF